MMRGRLLFAVSLSSLCLIASQANAEIYDFTPISDNFSQAYAVAPQLAVAVTDPGSNQVLFTFANSGTLPSSITAIYFEDGGLLGIHNIDNPEGVEFEPGAAPPKLPGGEDLVPPFEYTKSRYFSADADPPNGIDKNGVDIGESVGIFFNLEQGKSFQDIIQAIGIGFTPNALPGTGTSLRIGLQVQSLGGNDQDSAAYIMTPVPAGVLLGLLGLGSAGLKLRRYV